jgi:hypothetical protein
MRMKFAPVGVVVVLSALCLSAVSSAPRFEHLQRSTATQGGPATRGMAMSIAPYSKDYTIGKRMLILLELHNVSSGYVTFGPTSFAPAYVFVVRDQATGQTLPQLQPHSCASIYGLGAGLGPGESWYSRYPLDEFVDFKKPGIYDVTAQTIALHVSDANSDPNVVKHIRPLMLTSNTITINVITGPPPTSAPPGISGNVIGIISDDPNAEMAGC